MYKKLSFLMFFVFVLTLFVGTAPVFSLPIITAIAERNVDSDATDTPAQIAVPFQEDALVFVDRTHIYVALPAGLPDLVGAEYIMTANDNKNHSAYELDVTISQRAHIYVIIDNRMGGAAGGLGVDPILDGMPWVASMGFVDTHEDVGIDESADGDIDQYSSFFVATFNAGTVTIHGNTEGHGGNMLGVAVTSAYDPKARTPVPADGATGVPVDTDICWEPGDGAVFHEIYFGADPCALTLVGTQAVGNDCWTPPADLIASTIYYWQIVEVNGPARYEGNIWNFETVRGEAQPYFPKDGAVIAGSAYLSNIYTTLDFTPGATTVKFTGYFSENYDDVYNRVEDVNGGQPPIVSYPHRFYTGLPGIGKWQDSLVRGTTYYWAVDSEDALGNKFPSDVWVFTVQDYRAFLPSPPNEAVFVSTDRRFSWKAGFGATEHDIYIGTSYEAVRDARYDFNTPPEPNGSPYVGPDEYLATTMEPNLMVTGLAYDTKYYWRVDEVKDRPPPGIPGGTYYYGHVWTFTTHGPITGLTGEYYHHSGGASPAGFETKMLVRVDPEINFDWVDGAPDPMMSSDRFSVRWTGRIAVPAVGTYTFTTETDDGVRLWVNDTLIIDHWVDQGTTAWSGSIQLNSFGPHDIKMEYYENGGGAVAILNWAGPSVPYGVVPSNYLAPNYDAFTAANPRPRDGYLEPNPQPTLTWTPGAFAATHELYFSSDFNDVNERTASKIVLTAASYAIPAQLDMDQVYYWAIDEVNGVGPAPGFWPGDVWSFIIPPGGTGRAVREWWLNIGSGTAITDLTNNARYPDWPTGWEYVNLFEGPTGWADNYGSRISGWLRPPTTGDYTFWIATDDNGSLRLSTSEDPADANQISRVTAWASSRDFDDPDVIPSSPIHLEANKKYYIEGLMKEGGGGDNIAVAWQGPAPISTREVIDGRYLCATPYDPPYASNPNPANGSIVEDRTPLLSWWPGVFTQATNGHRLYFSTNRDDVNDRNPAAFRGTTTEPNYPITTPLELNRTYYWCVDEVSSTGPPPGLWYGRLWRFTMAECISIDSFEDYNDRNELRVVWTDGYASVVWGGAYPYQYVITPGSSGSNLNVSSAVGSPTGGTGPIHNGLEAMVLRYDNDGSMYTGLPGQEKWVYTAPYFSEIEGDTTGPGSLDTGLDWSGQGVKALTLWFQGHPLSDGGYDAALWPVYTVSGRGRDIWGRHDEFFYLANYPLKGSGTIQVKVTSIDDTDPWAKAGVMIREKWAPYSKFAAVYVTPGNGVSFQWRANEDAACSSITKPGITVPVWVKLERTISNTFIAKYSLSGSYWEDVNDTTAPQQPAITMGAVDPNIYIGTAVTSHDALETCTAGFDALSFPSTTPPPSYVIGNIGTNDPNQLYVALSDGTQTVAVNHPDPNAVNLTAWQEWNIELTEFTGLNLSNVTKVHVGVGDRVTHPIPGGSGAIYIDDFRACPPRCVPLFGKPLADIAQPYDCTVDEKDIRVLAGDWLMRDELIMTSAPGASILHWALDQGTGTTAIDSDGTAHGTIVGADWISPGSNGAGYCLNFNGVGDYVQVPDGNDANAVLGGLDAITVSIWVKSDVTNTDKGFFICEQPNGSDETITMRYDAAGASYGGTNLMKMGVTTTAGVVQLESSNNSQSTDWQHLVMTWSSGEVMRFYIDGLEDTPTGTSAATVGTITDITALIVGKGGKDTASNQGWDGLIDDLRIYNFVLSREEIVYLATNGAPSMHIPIASDADLYKGEPQGSQWINLKDYSIIADQYLEKILWP